MLGIIIKASANKSVFLDKIFNLNLPFFIYQKLRSSNDKSNISSRIIKIAITSVFLGVFISLSAISIGKGLQLAIKDKLYSLSEDIIISTYENNSRGILSQKIFNIEDVNIEIQNKYPDLQLSYSIEKPSLISNENSFESIVFRGFDNNYNFENLNKFILGSRIQSSLSNKEIIISKSLSDKLKVNVGEYLSLYFQTRKNQKIPNIRSYKVLDIFKTDFTDFDNNYIIGSAESLQNIYSWKENEFASINISVYDNSKIPITEESLSKLKSIEKNNLSVKTVESKYQNIFSWISIFDFNIIIITILMILVAIISVIISLFIFIFEKIKMIGILTSLGLTNNSLREIFIYLGIDIILKGMIPANILFFLVSVIQNNFKIIKLDPNDYYINSVPFSIDLVYIISLNSSFIITSLIILYFTFVSITKYTPSFNINSK